MQTNSRLMGSLQAVALALAVLVPASTAAFAADAPEQVAKNPVATTVQPDRGPGVLVPDSQRNALGGVLNPATGTTVPGTPSSQS